MDVAYVKTRPVSAVRITCHLHVLFLKHMRINCIVRVSRTLWIRCPVRDQLSIPVDASRSDMTEKFTSSLISSSYI